MALALTAALTFTPIGHDIQPCPEGLTEMWNVCVSDLARRWIPTRYREEARHRNHTSGNVTAPPSGVERWRSLVAAYFQPEDVAAALRVIKCESGFVLTADNPRSTAWGPWQFLRSTWNWVAQHTGSPSYDSGAPTDPHWSTINAAWLWYNVGPSQWSCW